MFEKISQKICCSQFSKSKVTVISAIQVVVNTRVWSLSMYISKDIGNSGNCKGSISFMETGADERKINVSRATK